MEVVGAEGEQGEVLLSVYPCGISWDNRRRKSASQKMAIHEVKANIVYIWEKVQMEAQVLFQIFKPSSPKDIKMV